MNKEEFIKEFELWTKEEILERTFDICSKNVDLQQENKLLKIQVSSREETTNKYKEVIDKLKEWIYIVQQNKDAKHLDTFISTDELDELLDILKEADKEV